jgi:hypothetical protein
MLPHTIYIKSDGCLNLHCQASQSVFDILATTGKHRGFSSYSSCSQRLQSLTLKELEAMNRNRQTVQCANYWVGRQQPGGEGGEQLKGIALHHVRGVKSKLKRSVLINCLVALVHFLN